MTVRPEMFKGRVNVRAVTESMAPEGRGERQKRLDFWLAGGMIDPKTYFDLFNHPHLGRAVRPGGVHATMAEQEHASMLRGSMVLPIEAHDDDVHIAYHTEFMASPEFLQLEPQIQLLFQEHKQAHEIQQFNKMVKEAGKMAVATEMVPSPDEGSTEGGNPPSKSTGDGNG